MTPAARRIRWTPPASDAQRRPLRDPRGFADRRQVLLLANWLDVGRAPSHTHPEPRHLKFSKTQAVDILAQTLTNRIISPPETLDLAVFLTPNAASVVTTADLLTDGGLYCGKPGWLWAEPCQSVNFQNATH